MKSGKLTYELFIFMRMEFLDVTGGGEYPNACPKFLIRLSGFTDEEKLDLINSIEETVLERNETLMLHKLSCIDYRNCAISLRLGDVDEGLVESGSVNEYNCVLSPSAYRDMIEIIRNVEDGHNWLTPGEYLDEPAFLISKWGPW